MQAYELRSIPGAGAPFAVERPTPAPASNQVLIRVRALSLNYRDLMMVGRHAARTGAAPLIPFSDGAGEVAALGGGVSRVKLGDRVMGSFFQNWIAGRPDSAALRSGLGGDVDGMAAEYVVLHERGLVPIPEYLSFEEAATLPCAALTAWHGLMVADHLPPGATVVVLGTGGVSIFALQLAKLAGLRVVATTGSGNKVERLRSLKAEQVINYRDTPEWSKRVLELTGGVGADHVVEVGGTGTLPQSIRAVRVGGVISLIGRLAGAGGQMDPLDILYRQVQVKGLMVGSRQMLEEMTRALELHRLKPVIDRVFPFAQTVEAMEYMRSGAHFGKVCIRL